MAGNWLRPRGFQFYPNGSYLQIKVKEVKAREAVKERRMHAALSDWRVLQDGEVVTIVRNAKVISQGRVEEVSGSGGVMWIVNEESETQTFFKSDGVFVRRG